MLNSIKQIKTLSSKKQQDFELFYKLSMRTKVLPFIADLTLVLLIFSAAFGAIPLFTAIAPGELTWSSFPSLTYVYWLGLLFLLGLNQFEKIRHKAPLIIYITTLFLFIFSYRDYILRGGGIDPIFGMLFYSAFLGSSTVSIRHVAILQLLNLLCLTASSFIIALPGKGLEQLLSMLSNWFIFNCFTMSLTAGIFSQWLSRNMFAMQFLLNEKNEVLSQTLKTLKTTEKQLIQQQKYKALNHMAKGLLHEIINPVNSASQAIGFAKSISDDEDINEALEEANSQHQRISDIVTDLRRFSQPEAEHELESIRLEDLVAKALKFCHRELQKADIQLNLQIAEAQLIDCHPSALTQVFVNLILNSCDALVRKKSQQQNEITISSFEQSETISISFRDNGIGISNETLQSISDPFFSDEKSPEKMGLGLSICQTIMRHHNGTVETESKENEWTEVVLTLPAHIKLGSAPITAPPFENKQISINSKQGLIQTSSNNIV